jgi:hypothetical protein
MEEEFVPYELALKLKEKGFDETCIAYYNKNGVFYAMGSITGFQRSFFGGFVPNLNKKLTAAPLWQQAFDWFREKHNLSANIWSGKISSVFYGYDVIDMITQEAIIDNSNIAGGTCDYSTYYEARTASLEQLIKLI